MISSFEDVSFMHVYREHKSDVDLLSKLGIGVMDFFIHYEIEKDSLLPLRVSLPLD